MADLDTQPGAVETRYKIGDVCRLADVQPYVLRYWESEFPALTADKAQVGPRTYTVRELRIIEQIKKLLYDEGYTIAGAKKRLESEALAVSRAEIRAPASSVRVDPRVAEVKPLDARGELKFDERARPGQRRVPAELPLAVPPPPKKAERPDTDKVHSLPPVSGVAPAAAIGHVKTAPVAAVEPARAPAVPPPDPRVAQAVAELRDILKILAPER
jgi:DNA-binding transcriptional MerR regulator